MKKFYFLFSFFFFGVGFGQSVNPADRDPSFNQIALPLNHYYIDASVIQKTKVLSDDSMLVLKDYELIKLNNNNALDTSFALNYYVNDFIVQPDGKIILIKRVTISGYNANQIVRINSNGTLDTTFTSGTSFISNATSNIYSVVIQSDGKYLVGGLFTSYQNTNVSNFIRLNQNGTLDTSFVSSIIPSPKPLKLVYQNDGKLLVFNGYINSLNGNNACKLYRLNTNGTLDSSFITGVGFGFQFTMTAPITINDVKIQTDGKLLVCGNFYKYNEAVSTGLVRINTDGTLDSSFATGYGFLSSNNTSASVISTTSMLIEPDGKIIIAGNFYNYNGTTVNRIIKLLSNGNVDTSFTGYVGSINSGGLNTIVNDLSYDNNGKIICSGNFLVYKNKACHSILKIDSDGNQDLSYTNFCKAFDAETYMSVQQPDGKVIVIGDFKSFNGITCDQIVRLNSDDTIDTTFTSGNGVDDSVVGVNDMILQPDGKIIVAGNNNSSLYGTYINGYLSSSNLIRFNSDGTKDTSFLTNSNNILKGSNLSIALQSNGKILISGNTIFYNNVAQPRLIRLNSDGTLDTTNTFAITTSSVGKVVVQPNGTILLVMKQTSSSNPKIIRLFNDFTLDNSFSMGTFTASNLNMKLQADGKVLVRVSTTNLTTNKIIRLNSNGSLDTSFNLPTSINVNAWNNAIEILNDGKILVYESVGSGNGLRKILRLNYDGSLDATFNSSNYYMPTTNTSVTGINQLQNGKIMVCGNFISYDGLSENRIVRLTGEKAYQFNGHCTYDYNQDGCDVNDHFYPDLHLNITNGTTNINYFADGSGNFNVPIYQDGITTIVPQFENNTYFTFSPNSVTLNFPTQASPASQNFCIIPNGIHHDIEVVMIPLNVPRPGFDADYLIKITNKGNQIESGNLNLLLPSGVTYVFSDGGMVIDNNNIGFSYFNLNPFNSTEIFLRLRVNSNEEMPPININDLINFYLTDPFSINDETPFDNDFYLSQVVMGSYDPNDKTCLQGETISETQIGDYVHYIIRFENTGNYAAQNVKIKDEIDISKFDINTLIPIKGSASFITRITDVNKVEFYFENINLPFADATNDGYVAFKIKTKSTLVAGDSFSNSAGIYFDYNYPIITNTATTTITALANQDFTFSNYFVVYPNPVKDTLKINKVAEIEISSITIYNMLGQIVVAIPNAKNIENIDVSELKTGNYFVKINSDKGTSNTKFIKL